MSVGKKIGIGAVGLVILAILFLVEEHFRGKIGLRKWKQRMEAKGERLRIDQLEPQRVPAEKNGMPAFIWAAGQLSGFRTDHQPPTRFVAPGKALVLTKLNGWTVRSGSKATNVMWQDLATSLEDRRAAIDGALEALEAEFLQANVHYAGGFSTLLPHLARIKSAAQVICTSALYDLRNKRADEGLHKLELLLRLLERWRDEPLIISQLVRIAIGQIAFATTWQAVNSDELSEEHFRRLQEQWSRLEFLDPIKNALAMERTMGSLEFERLRNSNRGPGEFDGGMFAGGPPATPFSLSTQWFLNALEETPNHFRDQVWTPIWKFAWSRHDELNFCDIAQRALEFQRTATQGKSFRHRPKGMEALSRSSLDDSGDNNVYDRIRFAVSPMIIPAYTRTFVRAWTMQSTRELAVAAIALRRYELKHGHNAPSLDVLVSELLTQPAWDYMDGKPLKYRINDGKPVLYSAGEDGIDDGGDPRPKGSTRTFTFQNGRDVVWPEPATAEEIEAYDKRLRAE